MKNYCLTFIAHFEQGPAASMLSQEIMLIGFASAMAITLIMEENLTFAILLDLEIL